MPVEVTVLSFSGYNRRHFLTFLTHQGTFFNCINMRGSRIMIIIEKPVKLAERDCRIQRTALEDKIAGKVGDDANAKQQ